MESGMVVICKVRAQVMSRDEYTGGWLPLPIRGGAVCSVMLCKSTSFNTSLNSTCSQNNASGSNNFLSDSNSNQQNQQTRLVLSISIIKHRYDALIDFFCLPNHIIRFSLTLRKREVRVEIIRKL